MLSRIRLGAYDSEGHIHCDYGIPPHLGGYELISATGLEPPTSVISYSEYAMVPGGRYHSSTQGIRNITLRIGLHPAPGSGQTVLDMRRAFFAAVPSDRELDIRLWNDGVHEFRIDGYLESIESDYFTQEPVLIVSLVCPIPEFRRPSQTRLDDQSSLRLNIDYAGDIPAGFMLTFHINEALNNTLYVENRTTGNRVEVQDSWARNDRVRIRTHAGARLVHYTDDGGNITGPLLGRTEVINDWPMIVPGENQFHIGASANNDRVTYDIWYPELFRGF